MHEDLQTLFKNTVKELLKEKGIRLKDDQASVLCDALFVGMCVVIEVPMDGNRCSIWNDEETSTHPVRFIVNGAESLYMRDRSEKVVANWKVAHPDL